MDRTVRTPPSLGEIGTPAARELVRAQQHFANAPPRETFEFKAYKSDDVRHALEALFHGKCAYCEARYDVCGPVDIEHFRPKAEVDGEPGHSGYWWLAAAWTNLLPSCIDCNRERHHLTPEAGATLAELIADIRAERHYARLKSGKGNAFPINGVRVMAKPAADDEKAHLAEQPLLIEPCRDDPGLHLRFHVDRDQLIGIVYPRPVAGTDHRGAVSIQVYGLNRLKLIQERTRHLLRLEFLAELLVDAAAAADELEGLALEGPAEEAVTRAADKLRSIQWRLVAEMRAMAAPDAPFSTMAAAWLEAFVNSGI